MGEINLKSHLVSCVAVISYRGLRQTNTGSTGKWAVPGRSGGGGGSDTDQRTAEFFRRCSRSCGGVLADSTATRQRSCSASSWKHTHAHTHTAAKTGESLVCCRWAGYVTALQSLRQTARWRREETVGVTRRRSDGLQGGG